MANRGTVRFFAFFDDTISEYARGNPSWEHRYTEKRYKILGFVKKGRAQYAWDSYDTVPTFQVYKPVVAIGELHRRMRVGIRRDHTIPIEPRKVYLKQEDGRQGIEILWLTRTSIWYACQNCWVPVVGALEPEKILGSYLYEAEPDSYEQCFGRQLEQHAERVLARRLLERDPPLEWDDDLVTESVASTADDEDEGRMVEEAIRRSMVRVDARRGSRAEGGAAGGGAAPPPPLPAQPSAPAAPSSAPAAPPPPPTATPFAPRHVLDLIKRDAVSKGDCCPISMAPFSECTSTTVTSCFHLFETESIRTWLSTKDSCPVCKQKVTASAVL